jgi:hypothetical protein
VRDSFTARELLLSLRAISIQPAPCLALDARIEVLADDGLDGHWEKRFLARLHPYRRQELMVKGWCSRFGAAWSNNGRKSGCRSKNATPTLVNDENLTEYAAKVLRSAMGAEQVVRKKPVMDG